MFLTPRWILSHAFVLALLILFVSAGVWQLDRLDARQADNERVEAKLEQVVALDLLSGDDQEPADLEFTRVELTGRWDPDRSRDLLVANRVADGNPGFWMWSVFDVDDGSEILVNRGFVSRSVVRGAEGAPPLGAADPAEGPVTVRGILRRGIDGGALSSDGSQISRPDAAVATVDRSVDSRFDASLYVESQQEDPPANELLAPMPPPDLGEGPHLGYAFQWFTFALLGAVGYGLVLRRIARGDASRGDVPA